eukprot:Clim_evm5s156 gene=Clim_evmTU5s156
MGEDTETMFYTYHSPWLLVAVSYYVRFPTHPRVPMLLNAKVIEHRKEGDVEYITRHCGMKPEAPQWLLRFFGLQEVMFSQSAVINEKEKWMKLTSRNLTYSSAVECVEVAEYTEDPDDPNKTLFYQKADLLMPSWFPMGSFVQAYAARQYRTQTAQGRKIDEEIIKDCRKANALMKWKKSGMSLGDIGHDYETQAHFLAVDDSKERTSHAKESMDKEWFPIKWLNSNSRSQQVAFSSLADNFWANITDRRSALSKSMEHFYSPGVMFYSGMAGFNF